jgi:hypothetical protein
MRGLNGDPTQAWEVIKDLGDLDIVGQENIMKEFYDVKPPKLPKGQAQRVFLSSTALYDIAKERKIKHQFKVDDVNIEYINDDPVLSLNWHFYKKELIIAGKSSLIDKYKLNDLMYDFDKLKELIVSVFSRGSEDYQYIMGLDTLWGWKELASTESIKEKIKNWVNNDFEPKYNGDSGKFLKLFRDKVKLTLRWKSEKLRQKISADDFVTNIASTGTSGSAFDDNHDRIMLKYNGEKAHFSRNKYAKSAYLSAKNKKERLFKLKRQKANVSQKVEFYPKVRIIVSSDFDTTMKMRFVDTWLTNWMSGNPNSTLWQTKKQSFDMWLKIARGDLGYNTPIDQSAFDHHVTKKMVLIMIEEIRSLINDMAENNEELLSVMDAIFYALDGGDIYYIDPQTREKSKWTYESGILSGWQWTAFLDTLANVAENLMAVDHVRDEGLVFSVLQFNAQGDDDLLTVSTPAAAFGILTALRSYGFEIHKYKSFISKKHNEYLRRYAKDGKLNGYPARMVNNLLWLYPGDRYQTDVLSRLSSTKDKWVKFFERMMNRTNRAVIYLKREYKAMKIKEEIYMKYLTTARTYGGAGLIKDKEYMNNYVIEQYTEESKSRVGFLVTDDRGYQDFRLRFGEFQNREMEQWLLKSIDAKIPDEPEMLVTSKLQPDLKPLPFIFIPGESKPKTTMLETLLPNVIFGKSKEFMSYAFPNIDTFTELGRAPKSWIYDYLSGRLKPVTPKLENMSDEFSSMLYDSYQASIINAMYYKKTVPDKWVRLNLYAEQHFPSFIYNRKEKFPEMY